MRTANLQRLLTHLKADSLAARLVAARIANQDGKPTDVLGAILKARLDELRREHEPDSKT